MATVDQQANGDFVISPAADQALTNVSDDLAELILQFASKRATTLRRDGTRLVTSEDIKTVILSICDVLESGITTSKTSPTGAAEAAKHLRAFCESIPPEERAK